MKIALIENFGSDFYGARLRYALFLKEKGHDVIAIVPNDGYVEKIKKAGITTLPLDIDIRKRSLGNMLTFAKGLKKIFIQEKFDVVHFYRMQPNIIGTPVAFFSLKKCKIINHITGLGVAFTKSSFKFNVIKAIIKAAYNINNGWFNAQLIFQNEEDKIELGNREKFLVVKGSAVNEDRFRPDIEVSRQLVDEVNKSVDLRRGKTLIFVSRLLKQKGLAYLIDAVNKINNSATETKFNLLVAGWIDPNNPDSFTEAEIQEYGKLDCVAFLGKRSDVNELMALADIAILPTFYREGTPRFLLEAMAMGKPILTTDMPGCNHLVKGGATRNGILVEVQDSTDIIRGLQSLIDSNLGELGVNSRLIYENEFSEKVVYNQLLDIYKLGVVFLPLS